MFPLDCVLEWLVRSEGDANLADANLRFFILECKDRKADGYAADEIEIHHKMIKDLKLGVRLADKPPAISYLAILGSPMMMAEIVAIDKTVIVIRLDLAGKGGRMSYLVYDAVALSLRMIPLPRHNPSWIYTITSKVSIARPPDCKGHASYALVHTGRQVGVDKTHSLYLWRPSSSSRAWLDRKECSFPALYVQDADTLFSFNGCSFWVDLLRGASYCSCDALLDDGGDNSGPVQFDFIPLPVKQGEHRCSNGVPAPVAFRTMGVVRNSIIRFVSISGFQNHVKLENRTVTVWKLPDPYQDAPWELEHKISLQTLWGFKGFGNLPKHLTLMYPLLSSKDMDIVYLVLGECREKLYNWKFIPSKMCHLLTVNMRNKTVTSVNLPDLRPNYPFISCGISQRLGKALVGPCDDGGVPMKEEEGTKEPRCDGGSIGTKKQSERNKSARKAKPLFGRPLLVAADPWRY